MVEADLVYRLRNTEMGEVVHERRFRARSEVDLDYDDRGIGFFEGLFRFPLLLWSEDDEDRWRAIREKVLPHATYLVKKNLVVDLLTELDPVARERAFGALVHPTGHQSPEVALVVGVSDYRADAYRGRCLFGEKDAIAFRDHLADGAADRFDPGALELLVGKQATLAGIERALLKTFRGTPGRERITLYFSGLGMAESRDGGHRFYLLPRDADPDDLDGTAIPLDEIAAYVRGSVAREVVVIVDAAFGSRGDSKGAPRESAPSPEERAALQRLAEEMGSDGEAGPRLVVLAARAGDAALELTQAGTEHGNLTFALLRALDGGKADRTGEGNDDGLVTVGELKGYLPGAIEREARFENQKQVPLVYGNDETILRQLD